MVASSTIYQRICYQFYILIIIPTHSTFHVNPLYPLLKYYVRFFYYFRFSLTFSYRSTVNCESTMHDMFVSSDRSHSFHKQTNTHAHTHMLNSNLSETQLIFFSSFFWFWIKIWNFFFFHDHGEPIFSLCMQICMLTKSNSSSNMGFRVEQGEWNVERYRERERESRKNW